MVRFTQTNVKNHWLLRTHPIASKFFDAMYGDLWYTFTEEIWTEKYVDFVTRVNEFFPKIHPVLRLREKEEDDEGSGDFEYENRRLLTIDLTSTSSTGHDKWEQLTAFLDIDNPFPLLQQPSTSPAVAAVASLPAAPSSATGSLSSPPPRRVFPSFPRTDVFVLTFGAQAFQYVHYPPTGAQHNSRTQMEGATPTPAMDVCVAGTPISGGNKLPLSFMLTCSIPM